MASCVASHGQFLAEVRNKEGFGTWSYDFYEIRVRHVQGSAPDGHYGTFAFNEDGLVMQGIAVDCANGTCSPGEATIFTGSGANLPYPSGRHTVTFKTPEPHSDMQSWQPNYWGSGNGSLTVTRVDVLIPPETIEVIHNTVIAAATIVLNDPTASPSLPLNLKCNDDKTGGNQCQKTAMAQYSVHSMLVSLNIQDTPLGYSPSRGPSIDFNVTYNQKESRQPAVFPYSNFGPKWTFNWLSYVTDDPATQLPSTSVYVPGGGAEIYHFDSTAQTFSRDPQSQALLTRTGPDSYTKEFPDGSKQIFGLSDGATAYPRKIFMTQVIDPANNSVSIGYDSSFRVITITDALGQVSTVSYELADDPLKITRVTDPFGRFATFQYAGGQLAIITDEIGIQSQFTYTPGTDSIDSLTTPYGTTVFASGVNGTNRWIEITDPLGGKERVEYRDQAPGIGASDPVAPGAAGITNADLDTANTFYWDKKAMLAAPGDYTKARIKHWLYNADGSVSGILSSEKQPLENRVWYTYAGQPAYLHAGPTANPSQVARVLTDGATQLSQFEYNSMGKTTRTIDAVGRVMSYVYDANNIDLLEIRQTTGTSNKLLRAFTYNSQHQALTDTDAAGQSTVLTYNASGQMLTTTNAKNETITLAYGGTAPAGCLASITSPPFNGLSAVTSFSYDGFNRVRAVTDSDGYTVTTDYDNLDRKTKITYPDGTFEQFQYTDNVTGAMTLDLTATRDRRGLWTYRHYNANRQMDSIKDPANRTTNFGWCTCGALESITDPKGQTTTFHRDLQGRVYQKVFADNTTIDYLFEGQSAANTPGATSRLQSSTDAKNQRTNYLYFPDNNVQQISYTDTAGQPLNPPTPSVSYTYGTKFNRVKAMTDGAGTTTYRYNGIASPPAVGAGQLASIKGPLNHDKITFGYDELGRVTNRSIKGAANSSTWTFDSLGRVSSEVNNLGTFNYSYVGVTGRLSSVTYPSGQSTSYAYFPNAQDKRLQEIRHQTSLGLPLSEFDYTYDRQGQIKTWSRSNPSLSAPQRSDLGYDNADQLLTAPVKDAVTNALVKQYIYAYDLAGNRTSERVGNKMTVSTPNNVNELVTQSGAVNRTLTYDPNGSLINDGSNRTFEWDAANRLVAVNYTGTTNRSEFSYDGLSRCVKIVEKTNGVVNSTRKFVWCGTEKCEFRNANDGVTARVYSQGQHSGGVAYFYTRDHLGSIREMVDGNGTVVARYDYDPYGQSNTVIGTTKPDLNFTGLYRHAKSNLDLATYRAYDPDLGRWLSRDPVGEMGGLNLYGYVGSNPLNDFDTLGLWGANAAYDDWLNIAANGLARGGVVGYTQAIIGTLGMTAIEFWMARELEDNAERSGSAAGAGCTKDALQYGGLAAGQIAWSAFGGYALNNILYPFYRFVGPGSRPGLGTGTWLTRALVGTVPYGSIANGVSKLQIPAQSGVNCVVRAKGVWWKYVAGSRRAVKYPQHGVGRGSEYRVGGFRGE